MNIETQVKHNGTTIALTPVLTLQTYHKPRVLLNLEFFFYNPAIAIFVKDLVLKVAQGDNISFLTLFVQFLCSHFNCVKDRDFLLSDFSSGSITHILILFL